MICPMCGEKELYEIEGTYEFNPPVNISGGMIIIHNTKWKHCFKCDEDILPHELNKAIDQEVMKRCSIVAPEITEEMKNHAKELIPLANECLNRQE